jgi:hypothetical protein
MLSGIHDIFAEQNSQYSITFQRVTADDVAIPVTEIVHFIVRRSSLPQDKNMFEIKSSGDIEEGYVSFPDTDYSYGTVTISNNSITINITSKTMEVVPCGSYFYYLNLVNGEETVQLLKGRFYVEAP